MVLHRGGVLERVPRRRDASVFAKKWPPLRFLGVPAIAALARLFHR